jgi:hypothetical protein
MATVRGWFVMACLKTIREINDESHGPTMQKMIARAMLQV